MQSKHVQPLKSTRLYATNMAGIPQAVFNHVGAIPVVPVPKPIKLPWFSGDSKLSIEYKPTLRIAHNI